MLGHWRVNLDKYLHGKVFAMDGFGVVVGGLQRPWIPLEVHRVGQPRHGVQEEGDRLLHLAHPDKHQHGLEEGKRKGVVVPAPGLQAGWDVRCQET